MSIIAIYSGVHSSGEEIAKKVAQRLNYDFIGEELFEEAAQTYGTSVAKLSKAMGKRALIDGVTHDWEKSIVYIKASLAHRIRRDNLVYHGPAMHLIPTNISHVLKVGLVADLDFRTKRVTAKTDIIAEKATLQIENADNAVAKWIGQLFDRGPWDPSLYDMKIPVSSTSQDDIIDMICGSITKEALLPNEKSIQAAQDFVLATRVNLKLVENGHDYCDVRAIGDEVRVIINKNHSARGAFIRAIQNLRYDQAEKEVKKICLDFEGVNVVRTNPGEGYKQPSRALLVDDEEEYVLTLSERLNTRNISSNVVHDGEQALDAVDGQEPDVMVLDLKMPGIDGIEVLRRVKREHPRVEVIILTGHGCEKDEVIAKELGAFAFLTKPVDIDVLAETMKQAYRKMENSNASQE